MKKFMVYMEDREDVFKVAVPAESEKKAREYVEGNGEVITIKDVTADYPISNEKVARALEAAGFGKKEMDFITRALYQIGIAD